MRPCADGSSSQAKTCTDKKTARISIFHKEITDFGSSIPGLL